MTSDNDATQPADGFEKAAAEALRRLDAPSPTGHAAGEAPHALDGPDARAVEAIAGVLRTLKADADPHPDEALRRRTGRAVRRALRRKAQAQGDPRPSVLATLLGALGGPQQMPGFRSGATQGGTGTRHLSYVADNLAVDLRIEPAGTAGAPRALVLGQIDRDGRPADARVLFDSGAGPAVEAHCDEHGELEIELEPGVYAITVLLEDVRVELPGEVRLP